MSRTTTALALTLILSPLALMTPGCSNYRESNDQNSAAEKERERAAEQAMERDELMREARQALREFREADPSLEAFFDRSAGYAIFPDVTKGAAIIGAANGPGVLFENGEATGWLELTQVNVGLQLGGQGFMQLVFLQDARAVSRFKRGEVEFSANASAVAAESGAAATNDYEDGVAVFSLVRGGLMFEASIGGQDFDYEPMD